MTFAAVVVYNKACENSPTCKALAGISGVTVLIYDNSTKDFGNRAYCEEKGWTYLGGQGNMGISKAYNACVDAAISVSKTGTLCLFDDDTELDPSYFAALEKARQESDAHIFVPAIYAAGTLISPCMLLPGHKVRMFATPQEAQNCTDERLSAINSCMAIDLGVFADFRYDENIFLDGVDHHFTRQMHGRGETFCLMDYRCDHGFSGMEKPPKASAMVRFKIYAKDYRYILKDQKSHYLRLVGKRALRLCISYRSLAFLKAFFREWRMYG